MINMQRQGSSFDVKFQPHYNTLNALPVVEGLYDYICIFFSQSLTMTQQYFVFYGSYPHISHLRT